MELKISIFLMYLPKMVPKISYKTKWERLLFVTDREKGGSMNYHRQREIFREKSSFRSLKAMLWAWQAWTFKKMYWIGPTDRTLKTKTRNFQIWYLMRWIQVIPSRRGWRKPTNQECSKNLKANLDSKENRHTQSRTRSFGASWTNTNLTTRSKRRSKNSNWTRRRQRSSWRA